MEKCCDTCEYYTRFEGVCCNGDSEHRADFTEVDFVCEHWVEKNER